MLAPVALFVYARPVHTRRTIDALLANQLATETDLIVFSDAERTTSQEHSVALVRSFISKITGFKSITLHFRPYNFGLSKSIISGVSQVLDQYGKVIVLEDDMVTSPYFLKYMNDALDLYIDDSRVVSIHGYVYPVKKRLPEAFFLRGADCWGWATWSRGWALFNPDGRKLLSELRRRRLTKAFDFDGTYPYTKMLEAQVLGKNDSWAVRWYASAFLAGKLTLYPGRSLVHNIGNDSSGTHCSTSSFYDSDLSLNPICLDSIDIKESESAKNIIEKFFRCNRNPFKRFMDRFLLPIFLRRLKAIVIDLTPPFLVRKLQQLLRPQEIKLQGCYLTWDEADNCSTGYDSVQTLQKVLEATVKVKNGDAVFERDSVLFSNLEYSWPVTAGLLRVAALDRGRLSVLDFGGFLGSSYFQNRKFLDGLPNVRWSVVEQPHFVDAGRRYIQDEYLTFYGSISECVAHQNPNVVILSSVLQYLEHPYAILDELFRCGVKFFLLDRTCFTINNAPEFYKIQSNSPSIYSSSYPIRFFNRIDFLAYFNMHGYRLVEEFPSLDNLDSVAKWQGFIFQSILN